MRSVLLAMCLAACTTDPSTPTDAGPCPVVPDCGPYPAMPETHPTWETINNQPALVFGEHDGRALVAWTYAVAAYGACQEGK